MVKPYFLPLVPLGLPSSVIVSREPGGKEVGRKAEDEHIEREGGRKRVGCFEAYRPNRKS